MAQVHLGSYHVDLSEASGGIQGKGRVRVGRREQRRRSSGQAASAEEALDAVMGKIRI